MLPRGREPARCPVDTRVGAVALRGGCCITQRRWASATQMQPDGAQNGTAGLRLPYSSVRLPPDPSGGGLYNSHRDEQQRRFHARLSHNTRQVTYGGRRALLRRSMQACIPRLDAPFVGHPPTPDPRCDSRTRKEPRSGPGRGWIPSLQFPSGAHCQRATRSSLGPVETTLTPGRPAETIAMAG